jgi:chromosomal replication initiator protein
MRFPLTSEIVDYIVDHFQSAHALIKALDCLVLRSHLGHKDRLNLSLAKSYLGDLIEHEKQAQLDSKSILKMVAEVFGIKTEDILGKSQCREFVLPRQIAMYLCRQTLKMPYTKIGSFFSRDHSTVMTSVKSISQSVADKNKEISSCLNQIQRKVVNL